MKARVLLLLMALIFVCTGFSAPAVVERVQMKAGQVVISPGEEVLQAPNRLQLPFNIVIETNGTFTVGSGKVRTLQEGETLGADGMLTKPDGTDWPGDRPRHAQERASDGVEGWNRI